MDPCPSVGSVLLSAQAVAGAIDATIFHKERRGAEAEYYHQLQRLKKNPWIQKRSSRPKSEAGETTGGPAEKMQKTPGAEQSDQGVENKTYK